MAPGRRSVVKRIGRAARRGWRLAWRAALGAAALLLVAVIALVLVLQTDWGRERVRRIMEAELDELFVGDVTVGRVEGNVLSGFAVLDVAIRDADGEIALRLDSVEIDHSVWALFRRKVHASTLRVTDVEATLRETRPGVWNVAGLLRPSEREPTRWRLVADRIEIRGGRVVAERANGERVHIDELEVDASGTFSALRVAVDLERLSASWAERAMQIQARSAIELGGDRIEVRSSSLSVGPVTIEVPGVTFDMGSGKLGAEGTARLAAQQPRRRLRVPESTWSVSAQRVDRDHPVEIEWHGNAGNASARGHASVDTARRAVVGDLSVQAADVSAWVEGTDPGEASAEIGFSLSGTTLDELGGTLTIDARGGSGDFRVEELQATARLEGRAASVDATVRAPGATATLSGRIASEEGGRLRLEKTTIHATAELSRALQPWFEARGSLVVDLETEGTLPTIAVRGGVRGTGLSARELRAPSLTATLDLADALENPQGSIAVWLRAPRFRELRMRELSVRGQIQEAGERVRLVVTGRGPPDSLRATLEVRPRQMPIRVEIREVDAELGGVRTRARGALAFDPTGSLEIDRLDIESDVGSVSGHGHIGFAAGSVHDARIVARGGRLDLAALRQALGLHQPLRGKIDAEADIRVVQGVLLGEVSAGATGVALFPRAPTVDGTLSLRFSSRRLSLSATGKIATLGAVSLAASVRPPRDLTRIEAWSRLRRPALLDARVDIDGIELGRLARVIGVDRDLRGRLAGTLQVDAGANSGKGRFTLRDFHTAPLRDPVDATLDIALDSAGATTVTLVADGRSAGKLQLAVTGQLPVQVANPEVWRRAGVEAIHTARLQLDRVRLHREMLSDSRGVVAGVGAIDGVVEVDAVAGTASASLKVRRLSLPLVEECAELDLVGTILAGGVSRASLIARGKHSGKATAEVRVAGPAKLLDLEAWRALDEDAVRLVRVRATGVRIEEWMRSLAPGLQEIPGALTAEIELGRGLRSGKLVVDAGKLQVPQLARRVGFGLTADLRRHEIEARLRGKLGARKLVAGTVTLGVGLDELIKTRGRQLRSADLSGNLTVSELSLTSALASVGQSYPVRGKLTASGSVSGSIRDPIVNGEIHIDEARLHGIRFRELRASLGLTQRGLRAKVSARQEKGGTLAVAVAAPRQFEDKLTASIVASAFDLGFASGFLPDTQLQGLLSADLSVRGTRRKPRASGWARVEKGRLRTGLVLPTLYDGHAELAVDRDEVTVRTHARAGRGRVEAVGSARIDGLEPISSEGQITMRSFPVEAEGMLVSIDSRVSVKVAQSSGDWRAEVDIGKTTVRLPRTRTRTLHPIGRPEDVVFVEELTGARSGALTRIAARAPKLRVAIRADESIAIHGPEVNTQIDVNLEVVPLPRLSIQGTVATVGGYVVLFGRKYEILRANASFAGADSTQPYVDVRLAHEFPSLTIYIDVLGPLDRPTGRISSDPAIYDETQLLAFVLGATPGEESPSRPLSDRGVSVASSLVTSQLQQMVAGLLPVDVVKVDLDDEARRAERVTIGRWITDRLFLAYRHRFTATPDENSGEAAIEYRLWRRWMLEAYAGDRGAGGADLLWIRRY